MALTQATHSRRSMASASLDTLLLLMFSTASIKTCRQKWVAMGIIDLLPFVPHNKKDKYEFVSSLFPDHHTHIRAALCSLSGKAYLGRSAIALLSLCVSGVFSHLSLCLLNRSKFRCSCTLLSVLKLQYPIVCSGKFGYIYTE